MPSTLQVDPSRTLALRKQFASQVIKRVRMVPRVLRQFDDHWPMEPTTSKLNRLVAFLQQQLRRILLDLDKPAQQSYLRQWVTKAYLKGCKRAYTDCGGTKPYDPSCAMWFEANAAQFVGSTFDYEQCRETVDLLVWRLEYELENLAQSIARRIARTYVDTMVLNFTNAQLKKFAEQLGVDINKARTIANTEIVRAQAEGILDSYKRLGKTHVKVLVEWTTAGDSRVCNLCRPLAGAVFTIQEARGMFPRHPNCRCTPVVHEYTGAMGPELTKGRRKRINALKKSIAGEKPVTGKRRKVGRPKTSKWTKTVKRKYDQI